MERFSLKTAVLFGDDALTRLEHWAGKPVFVVTDAFLASSGALDRIRAHLPGSPVTVFDQVTPDPSLELVTQGLARLQKSAPAAVIALGGGSPMDCAKAILHFGRRLFDLPQLPLIAIPTTSGTGSEVTSFAVITDQEKGVKYPLVDESLLPAEAILDPGLLTSLPPGVIADTGMDVLAHALEARVSTRANAFSDSLAEKSFVMAFAALKRSYEGDLEARREMHLASTLAGLAFDRASLGLNHALAHAIGGRFHIPHGRINALLLPHVVAFNAGLDGPGRQPLSKPAAAYGELARLAGLSGASPQLRVRSLISAIKRLSAALKLPERLSQCGVERTELEAAIPELCRAALGDLCLETNPRPVTESQLAALLRQIH